jgi:hypothetical protein
MTGKSKLVHFTSGSLITPHRDTVILIWEESLVHQFTNSPTSYDDFDVSGHFELHHGKMENIAPHDYQPVLNALLAPLMPTQVGMYGNWHMAAAKMLGLDHPEAIRLGNV